MARMMLYLDKSKQPADNRTMTFPIYKLDFDKLKTMTTITYGDTNERPYMEQNGGYLQEVTSAPREPCYYTRIAASSGSLYQCLSTNIPKQAWQEGSINRYRISPMIQDEYNIYAINPEYFNFERVEGENPPDDWDDNFWYWKETIQSFTYQSNSYQYYAYDYHLPTQSGGYSQNETWIRDVEHKLGAKFYTDSGYSFGWYWNPYTSGARSRFGNDMSSMQFFGWRKPETSSTTNEGIRVQTDKPYIEPQWVSSRYIKGIVPFARTTSSEKYKLLTGDDTNLFNYTAFFVSFYIDNIPFYGIAVTHTDSYGENATPQSIEIVAFTPDFWGGSIISGGEDGEWGDNTLPSIPNGTFTTNSTNVGDRDGQHIYDSVERRRFRTSGIFTSNVISIYEVGVYNDYTKLWKICSELYSNEFMTRYSQTYYDPLSSVLAMHLLPSDFCTYGDWGTTEYDVILAGYNVSDKWSTHTGSPNKPTCKKLQHLHAYHIGSIDIGKFYDGYPDFSPYTKAVLHLPFIGEVEVKINEIAHGVLGVTYACDVINGNVVAYIWAQDYSGNKQNIQIANGNCAYSVPLYSKTMDGSSVGKMLSGVVTTLASGVVGAMTHNPMSILGVVSGVANTFNAAEEASKTSTQVRGELGGSNMLMSPYDCWLELIHPQWVESMHYKTLVGHSSYMSNKIADNAQVEGEISGVSYNGYLQVLSIELDSVNCTESERSEIEKLLQSGVYVRGEEL